MAAATYAPRQSSSKLAVTQSITLSGASAAATNPFGPTTYQVRLACTSSAYYQIGDGAQTASITTSPFLPNTWVEYVSVNPGQRIAAIQQTAAGTFTVTEVV